MILFYIFGFMFKLKRQSLSTEIIIDSYNQKLKTLAYLKCKQTYTRGEDRIVGTNVPVGSERITTYFFLGDGRALGYNIAVS